MLRLGLFGKSWLSWCEGLGIGLPENKSIVVQLYKASNTLDFIIDILFRGPWTLHGCQQEILLSNRVKSWKCQIVFSILICSQICQTRRCWCSKATCHITRWCRDGISKLPASTLSKNIVCHSGVHYWNYYPGAVIFKSSPWHSFEDRSPVDVIHGSPKLEISCRCSAEQQGTGKI